MKRLLTTILTLGTLLNTASCTTARNAESEYLIGSTLWVQKSAEYEALCRQTYAAAISQLMTTLKNPPTGKPLAVVVDIDETVLDNSPYQAYLIKNNYSYPKGWGEWIDLADAKPVPGAREFLNFATENNVEIFYISNRKVKVLDSTLANLKKLELPVDEKKVFLRKGKSYIKTSRRNKVLKTHQIVLYIGDNLGDFDDAYNNVPSDARIAEVQKNQSQFGNSYFILPNPIYGDWSESLYFNKQNRKRDQVRLDSLIGY